MKSHTFRFAAVLAIAALPLALAPAPGFGASKAGSTSGNWGSGVAVSPVNQPDPRGGPQVADIAVNANGLTVAAWDQYTYNNGGGATIGVAVRTAGRWAAPFTISTNTGWAMNPRVAVGADGTMAVSWTYEDSSTASNPRRKVQIAVKPAGSAVWTTSTLADGTQGGVASAHFVPVGIDASGNVTAAWSYWDSAAGAFHSVLQVAHRPAGLNSTWTIDGTFDPGATQSAVNPDVAVNAKGDAAVVYSVSVYWPGNMPVVAMYLSRIGSGGTWSSPVACSETNLTNYVSGPMVALDSSGTPTVAFFSNGVEVNRPVAGGGWPAAGQPVLTTNLSGASYTGYDLGVDNAGNVLVAATIFDPTVGVDRSSAWVTRYSTTTGTWTQQKRLTDPTVPVDAYAAQVAVSPDGKFAVAGWIDHYHGTVQVAQLAGGTLSTAGTDTWTTSTIGRGTAFSSYLEVLVLEAGSSSVARALWKNAKTGTQWYASSYGQ